MKPKRGLTEVERHLRVSRGNSEISFTDFTSGPAVKNLPANAWDRGLIPGLGRFHMPRGNKA